MVPEHTELRAASVRAPRENELALVALPSAVGLGREFARATVRDWGYRDRAFEHDIQLIVSELVTNAIQAFPPHPPVGVLLDRGSLIRVALREHDDTLSIEVWDPHPQPPAPRGPVPDDAVRGRGLEIVASLARSVGYFHPRGDPRGGKVVFARIAWPRGIAVRHSSQRPPAENLGRYHAPDEPNERDDQPKTATRAD